MCRYYVNPDSFNPDRWNSKLEPFSNLIFSQGPRCASALDHSLTVGRNCIGNVV